MQVVVDVTFRIIKKNIRSEKKNISDLMIHKCVVKIFIDLVSGV